MWLDWLRSQPYAGDLEFHAPATPEALGDAEEKLQTPLPPDLRSLLSETDGLSGEFGLSVVWPTTRVIADNLRFRKDFSEVYEPFDGLLFFGDAGNGDQFAFRLHGADAAQSVYVWDHETDDRSRLAPYLRTYLNGWLSGSLKV
jgi:hypothetical protein